MYVLCVGGEVVAEAVVLRRSAELCELVNLATAPAHRGRGYASRLVRRMLQLYRPRCRRMEVGTDASTVPFYERFGFRYAYTRENFFADNYPPIVGKRRPA